MGNGNISGRSNNKLVGAVTVKSTQNNRSKSIDPTSKRLAKLPETTKKNKGAVKNIFDDTKIEITINQGEITPDAYMMKP